MHTFHDYGVPGFATQIPTSLQSALSKAANRVQYENGQDVHQRGDTHAGLSLICMGGIKLGSVDQDGHRLVTAILGPGHVFGEFTIFADLPRTHTATAYGKTTIDHISKAQMERLLASEPALMRFFLTSLTQRLHAVLEFAEDLRRLPPDVHAIKRLGEMAHWPEGPARIKITQSAMAQTLGISRMAMSTALKSLVKARLLRTGYGYIDIPDGNRLRAWLARRGITSDHA